MKAITLTQPWATLAAIGAKQIETRSWRTGYRGPLAIHAAKGMPSWAAECFQREPFRSTLYAAGYDYLSQLERGAVIAVTTLVDCRFTGSEQTPSQWVRALFGDERAFGDFGPWRYGWILGPVQRLDPPVPARGALSLWEWDDSSVHAPAAAETHVLLAMARQGALAL